MNGESCSFFDWVIFCCCLRWAALCNIGSTKTENHKEAWIQQLWSWKRFNCLPCESLPCCKNKLVRQNMYNKQFHKNPLVQANTTTPCKATKPTIKKDKIVLAYLSKKKRKKQTNKQSHVCCRKGPIKLRSTYSFSFMFKRWRTFPWEHQLWNVSCHLQLWKITTSTSNRNPIPTVPSSVWLPLIWSCTEKKNCTEARHNN